jgi:hypothetical protein
VQGGTQGDFQGISKVGFIRNPYYCTNGRISSVARFFAVTETLYKIPPCECGPRWRKLIYDIYPENKDVYLVEFNLTIL